MMAHRYVLAVVGLLVALGFLAAPAPNEATAWAVLLNPYATNSSNLDYVVEVGGVGGVEVFNPFAIPKVRQAINLYIDRHAIRSFLPSGSSIAYSPVRIGVQTTSKVITTPAGVSFPVNIDHEHSFDIGRFHPELNPWGNNVDLAAAVSDAMTAASQKTGLAGRLKHGVTYWEFDSKPIEVKVLRRSTFGVHRQIADFVAGVLGTCGFMVGFHDDSKTDLLDMVWGPASQYSAFKWSVFVEGWQRTDEMSESIPAALAASAYAALRGQMPSGFKTPLLDDVCLFMDCVFNPSASLGCGSQTWSWLLTHKTFGKYFTASDDLYWDLATLIVRMGMDNAVRIFLGFYDP